MMPTCISTGKNVTYHKILTNKLMHTSKLNSNMLQFLELLQVRLGHHKLKIINIITKITNLHQD